MDYRRVIEQEGYRLEDLKPRDQAYIKGMMTLLEMLQTAYQYEAMEEDDTIIGQLKEQIAEEVADDIYCWLEASMLEEQIGIAESYEDD